MVEKTKVKKAFDIISSVGLIIILVFTLFGLYWMIARNTGGKAWCEKWASDYFQPMTEEKYLYRYNGCMIARSFKSELTTLHEVISEGKGVTFDWETAHFWSK